MNGAGQRVGGEPADAAVKRHEETTPAAGPPQVAGDAHRPPEVRQVRAAAHADVLTGIDQLPDAVSVNDPAARRAGRATPSTVTRKPRAPSGRRRRQSGQGRRRR